MIGEIEKLFERQARDWPLLARGIEGLARANTRRVRIDWFDVFARHIRHRVRSTTAPVDKESIAKRPCFLCAGNLPPEQESVPFNESFSIYCNPFPIVAEHLTIIHREHIAQRVADQFGTMLDLAAALPGFFVIYNGPECGASAPDHLHFQAGSRELFPIQIDSAGLSGIAVPNYARNVLLFRERDRAALVRRLERAVQLLGEVDSVHTEPLLNIAIFREPEQWITFLFPRQKHRPEVFYTGELTVSPASIDLCGLFVVPLEPDFNKITAEAIAAIFREVTLPDTHFNEIVAKLESER